VVADEFALDITHDHADDMIAVCGTAQLCCAIEESRFADILGLLSPEMNPSGIVVGCDPADTDVAFLWKFPAALTSADEVLERVMDVDLMRARCVGVLERGEAAPQAMDHVVPAGVPQRASAGDLLQDCFAALSDLGTNPLWEDDGGLRSEIGPHTLRLSVCGDTLWMTGALGEDLADDPAALALAMTCNFFGLGIESDLVCLSGRDRLQCAVRMTSAAQCKSAVCRLLHDLTHLPGAVERTDRCPPAALSCFIPV